MKVLMFGWEFPPHNSGGLGTACEGLTRALSRLGLETIFVLPKSAEVETDFMRFRFAGIEKFTLKPVNGLLYPYVTSTAYNKLYEQQTTKIYGRNLLEEVRLYALRAREIALEETYDVIHAHDWLAFPAGLMAQELSGKPLVVHVHATEFDRSGGSGVNQEVYEIERAGMSQAQKIIAVSDWTKQMIVRHYGIPAEKVEVVHNGVEASQFANLPNRLEKLKESGKKIILFVGRITLQKGPDYFVRAAKKVLAYVPEALFVMVGSGDMEEQTIRLASELGLAKNFLFPGFLRGEELNQIYQSADLYVLPSVSEPFGITPLEALSNGTPVLVSKQSGVAEVISHALKVDFWDVDEMANQIIAVLKHKALPKTLLKHARQELPQLTWQAAAQKCVKIYQALPSRPVSR